MKVSELKPGMLLRFKEPMSIRHLRDHDSYFWSDFIQSTKKVDPLIVYLGQKTIPLKTYYGNFKKVRQVLIDGQTLWMWPDAWRYVEPAEKREDG